MNGEGKTLKERLRALQRSSMQIEQKQSDEKDKTEEENAIAERTKAEIDGIKQDNQDKESNRALREKYADNIFCYLRIYSLSVGILVVLAGLNLCGFTLPESVLGYLVGSTAVSAIGLVLAVTTGLFKP